MSNVYSEFHAWLRSFAAPNVEAHNFAFWGLKVTRRQPPRRLRPHRIALVSGAFVVTKAPIVGNGATSVPNE